MHEDGFKIGGQPYIKFDPVGAHCDGLLNRWNGVFWAVGAATSVRNNARGMGSQRYNRQQRQSDRDSGQQADGPIPGR